MFDALSCFPLLGTFDDAVPSEPPFAVELVAATGDPQPTASGIALPVHRSIADPGRTDIAIVPSLLVANGTWLPGRYPDLVGWLQRLHVEGALLCSACSGVLLIAETGLLSGRTVTMHPAYAPTFRDNVPDVGLQLDEVLVATGERQELVMAGASASWHDLVLYLVARHVGPTAAQALAKFLLLQWHTDGQAPYVPFNAPDDHGDGIVAAAQAWLRTHYAVAAPVTELVARSRCSHTRRARCQERRSCSVLSPLDRQRNLIVRSPRIARPGRPRDPVSGREADAGIRTPDPITTSKRRDLRSLASVARDAGGQRVHRAMCA
jgi:transcriptional regulator GlxA family with amidase domain